MSPRFVRRSAALAAIALSIPIGIGVVVADDISNDLDASVDAVAEVMPLNVGGPNGSTTLRVIPQNEDGKNGCNLTGSTTLTLSITSSNTSAATVSPASVTFTSCDDTKLLTVTPVALGTATISAALVSNNTAGTFNLAPATFTVNVSAAPPSNTAPTIAVVGVSGGASYAKGSVPAATCQVTDAEDGNSSFAATLSTINGPYAADGIGSQEASCTYTDGGGIGASSSLTYTIIDPTPPLIDVQLVGTLGNDFWYTSDVVVDWTVTESESPSSLVTIECDDKTVSTDGDSIELTCNAQSAGGTASRTVSFKRDATAPTLIGTPATNPNGAGWYKNDVTIHWTCTDSAGSGATNPDDTTITDEGNAQTSNQSCTDAAGNTTNSTSPAIKLDKTTPTVSWVNGIANGASFYYGDVPPAPTCSAIDGLSGVDGVCTVAGYSTATGTHSLQAKASDRAGNETTLTSSYSVLAWTLSGFYNPVDMNNVLNTVKSGATVPLKFRVFAGPTELRDVAVVDKFTTAVVACDALGASAQEDAIEQVTTGATSLRYDPTGGQFIQNWQTPKNKAGTCYRVTLTTLDGTSIVGFFKLK